MALDTNTPTFLQANSYPAEVTRRGTYGFMLARDVSGDVGSVAGGIVNLAANDCKMAAPVSGLSVNIPVGELICPGTSTTTQGGYYMRNASTTNLSIATADPTNPRVDLVCATVNDSQYSGVSNNGVLQVKTGTPTSGATLSNLSGAPALPTSSLLIGYVLVPANATNIVSADLGDHRAQVAISTAIAGVPTVYNPVTTYLGAPVTMTSANTFYDGPSTATLVTGGVYEVSGQATVNDGSVQEITVKIWDGTNTAVGEATGLPASGGSATIPITPFLYTAPSTLALKISAASQSTGAVLKADPDANSSGAHLVTKINIHRLS